jgi:ketol-acid reductoisomerase
MGRRLIGIIGYGSQGRAQALNLRDSGYPPLIGLRTRSPHRKIAEDDGMTVVDLRRLVKSSDIVSLLIPDHLHGRVFEQEIHEYLHRGQMLVFAHAASVHFGAVKTPEFVDTVLIAPLGPGKRLRELYEEQGIACFFAIHHDATGNAKKIGLALAKAIGLLNTGAIETTFAEEAVGDLFGEQAVLCGGLARLMKLGFDTLVSQGLSPEKAYLECVYQIDLIVDLVKSDGIAGMLAKISHTAATGAVHAGPRLLDDSLRKRFERLHREVKSGRFFSEILPASKANLHRNELTDAQFEHAAKRVRKLLGEDH